VTPCSVAIGFHHKTLRNISVLQQHYIVSQLKRPGFESSPP